MQALEDGKLHRRTHTTCSWVSLVLVLVATLDLTHYIQNVRSTSISSSTITLLCIEHQNGEISGYHIHIVLQGVVVMQLNSQHPSVTVTLLDETTTCEVSVAAITRIGIDPYSKPVSVTTKKYQGMLSEGNLMHLNL